jgi:hypothetical protein
MGNLPHGFSNVFPFVLRARVTDFPNVGPESREEHERFSTGLREFQHVSCRVAIYNYLPRSMKSLISYATLLCASLACSAVEFDLGSRGTLSLKLPPYWAITKNEPKTTNGVVEGHVLEIEGPALQKGVALINLGFTPPIKLDYDFVQKQMLHGVWLFDTKSRRADVHSIELFSLKRGYGAYSVVKDPAHTLSRVTKGNNFKGGLVGVVQPDEQVLGTVVCAFDDPKSREAEALIAMVNSMEVVPKRGTQSSE